MIRWLAILVVLVGLVRPLVAQAPVPAPAPAPAQELVRMVRLKISAGDLSTGLAYAEDHKRAKGVDGEYLSALGWIARGAEMLGRMEVAEETLRELKREIPKESAEDLTAYGAGIEVEGRLIHRRQGRGAAIRYFEQAFAKAEAPSLRSRIRKNINMLSLEGSPAPALGGVTVNGKAASLASLRGKPVVLFLFAEWCGDCKAQAPSLERVWQKYRDRVPMVALTRFYSSPKDAKPMTTVQETAKVQTVWKEAYPGLGDIPVVIDGEAMIRYGGSATPSFVLIDRDGVVRHFAATRMSEAELSRRIEELLAE